MKDIKFYKILISITCFVLIVITANIFFHRDKKVVIPDKLSPNKVVLYDNNLDIHIFDLNHKVSSNTKSKKNTISMKLKVRSKYFESLETEKKLLERIKNEAESLPYFKVEEELIAEPNTLVVYGSDGYINRVGYITEEKIRAYLNEEDLQGIEFEIKGDE